MTTEVRLFGNNGNRTIAVERDDRFTNARFGKVAPAPTEPLTITPDLPSATALTKNSLQDSNEFTPTSEVSPHDATAAVVTANPEPTTDLSALLAEVDACLNKNPEAKRHPVMQAKLQRGAEHIKQRASDEALYQKHNDVEAKRETAIEIAKKLGVL